MTLDVYRHKNRDESIARTLARENYRIAAVAAEAAAEMQLRDDQMYAQAKQWEIHRENIEQGYTTLQSQFYELQESKASEESRALQYETLAYSLFQTQEQTRQLASAEVAQLHYFNLEKQKNVNLQTQFSHFQDTLKHLKTELLKNIYSCF